MSLKPLIVTQVSVLVGLVSFVQSDLLEGGGCRIPDLTELRVKSLREAGLNACRALSSHVNHATNAVHPRENRLVPDGVSGSADGCTVAASFLDGLAVNDKLQLLVRESLVNDQFLLARTSGALHNDEGISRLHEPCLDLLDVGFAVVPDSVHTGLIVVFLASNEILGVSLEPFVELVVLEM